MRFAMKSISLGRHRHEAPVLLPRLVVDLADLREVRREALLRDVADDDVRLALRGSGPPTRRETLRAGFVLDLEPVGEQVLGLVESRALDRARRSSAGCTSSSGPATSRSRPRAARPRRSTSDWSVRAGPSSSRSRAPGGRGVEERRRDRRVVLRLEVAEEGGLLAVELVVVAVEDRGDPADVAAVARARRRAASRACRKNGFSSREDLREVVAQRRRPSAGRPRRSGPRRRRSGTARLLAAADAFDRDGSDSSPRVRRAASDARTGRTRPTSRPTFSIASSARESCSRVCVAISDVRMSARPGGVAGESTQLTKTPSSWSRWTILRAVRSSPTTTGTTGVCDSPVSRPERTADPRRRSACSPRAAPAARARAP